MEISSRKSSSKNKKKRNKPENNNKKLYQKSLKEKISPNLSTKPTSKKC